VILIKFPSTQHDTTIAALAATFGDEERLVPGGLPQYTASLAVELWLAGDGKTPEIKVSNSLYFLVNNNFYDRKNVLTKKSKN
jgi:hypothetical protein